MLEGTLALALVGASLIGTAQLLTVAARQRQATQRAAAAECEAANVLERVAPLSYSQLTPTAVQELVLSPEAQAELPGGKLRVDVDVANDAVQFKRIVVEVEWAGPGGSPRRCRLAAWKHAPAEAAP